MAEVGVFSLKKRRTFFCASCNKVHEQEAPPELSPDAEAASLVLSKGVVYIADAPLDAAALRSFPVLRDMVDGGSCGPLAQEPQPTGEPPRPAELWRLEQLLSGFSVPAPGSKPYRGAFIAAGGGEAAGAAAELARAHGLDASVAGASGGDPAADGAALAGRAAALLSDAAAVDVVWVYAAAARPSGEATEATAARGDAGPSPASEALARADAFFGELRKASTASGLPPYQLLIFTSLAGEASVREASAAGMPPGLAHLFPKQSMRFSRGEHNEGVTLRGCLFSVHFLPGVARRDAAVVTDGDPAAWVCDGGRGTVAARQAMPELLSRLLKFPKYGA